MSNDKSLWFFEGQLNDLNERFSNAQQRLQEKEDLINQLEQDLASVNTVAPLQKRESDVRNYRNIIL